ncbi:hypothetical protein OSTOST_22687 [Ostertagia ostertagi]
MMISKQAYTLSVLATQYAFPLFSLVFAYTRIAHRMKLRFANRNMPFPNTLSQNQRRRSVVERQRRTHLLLMCVVAVFAIAWLPLNVFHMWVSLFSVSTFAVCHVAAICALHVLTPLSTPFLTIISERNSSPFSKNWAFGNFVVSCSVGTKTVNERRVWNVKTRIELITVVITRI